MKDEITRINNLVKEGKLSPEDAAELIDAFYNSGSSEEEPVAAAAAGAADASEAPKAGASKPGDPFSSIVEAIERLGKEVTENVDWREVTENARTSAKKGMDALKTGLEEISKGRFQMGWLFSTATREVILPLTVSAESILRVENGCGDIKIISDSLESKVVAKARFRGASNEEARKKADLYSLMIESTESSTAIRQPHVSGQEVDLEIHLVTAPSIEIESEAGDVEVRDIDNSCRINSISGAIVLSGLGGQVEVNADSGTVSISDTVADSIRAENKAGNIRLTNVQANMNIRSASGDIVVGASSGRTIAAESVSGSIELEVNQPVSGAVSCRAVSGNSTVRLAPGADARVTVSTLRGVSYCNLELADKAQSDQRITGTLGDGTGTVDISSVTGNVSLGPIVA